MFTRNFRSLALVSIVSALALTGCNSKPEVVGPDPALSGSASPSGNASPANQGSSTDAPPPNSGKKKSAGSVQDKLCDNTFITEVMGGVVRPFIRFEKDGKTIVVDPCLSGGPATVSPQKINVKGREDLRIVSDVCLTEGESCWYRVLDLSKVTGAAAAKLKYATMSSLKLKGNYKDGEGMPDIPGDAKVTIGALVDDSGAPTQQTVKYVTRYVGTQKPTDLSDINKKLDALDGRMTKVETTVSGLVVAMAAYSDMVRRDEAM